MNRYLRALHNPLPIFFKFAGRVRPESFWKDILKSPNDSELKALYLILSFDCDTSDDAKVVEDLDSQIRELGIQAAYAIPGELLEKHHKPYRNLHEKGAEILNHGYKTHAVWNESRLRYESCNFYDELSRKEIINDVVRGFRAIEKIMGKEPSGFRTPHFGTYQEPGEIQFLHSVLAEIGMTFSSSTTPYWAYRNGPCFQNDHVVEVPLSGIFSSPFEVCDSWGFFASPIRKRSEKDYLFEIRNLVKFCKASNVHGLINIYCDPSHVFQKEEFFLAMNELVQVAKPTTFEEFINSAQFVNS